MPWRGPCLTCCDSPDARHRFLDAIAAEVNLSADKRAGARFTADIWELPVAVVEYIAEHWDGQTQTWRLDA